jgi:hypothetical protein
MESKGGRARAKLIERKSHSNISPMQQQRHRVTSSSGVLFHVSPHPKFLHSAPIYERKSIAPYRGVLVYGLLKSFQQHNSAIFQRAMPSLLRLVFFCYDSTMVATRTFARF